MAGEKNGSYQKGPSPQEVDAASSSFDSNNGGGGDKKGAMKRILVVGAFAAVALGAYYALIGPRHNAKAAMDKTIAQSGSIKVSEKSGKLKLFDNLSKFSFVSCRSVESHLDPHNVPLDPDSELLISTQLLLASDLDLSSDRYVLEDYDAKSTFSSFLPGVAGYFGKPVWAFYVNRGQAMATFGTESKDYPMLEFNPANKAYQLTPYVGFRTFIRGTRSGVTSATSSSFETEPFTPHKSRNLDDKKDDPGLPKRILYVGTNEVEVQEIDGVNGISTNVQYFILPEEDFASLVRRTTITNTGDTNVTISALDGLAKMEPFGGALDWGLKSMGRTLEGWMGVYHADDTLTMPFYKLSTETSDSAAVKIEKAGHYCLAFIESATDKAELLPVVYDTAKIFGMDTSLDMAYGLASSSVSEILSNPQYGWAKTSSAFPALEKFTLAPGQNVTIATVYGKASHIEDVPDIAEIVTAPGYITEKLQRARSLIDELTEGVETETVNPLFDGTVKQMFLDNSLRGGVPTVLGNVDGDATYDEDPGVKIFHSFSRIHGDLERDYNAFKIEPTYFSQGPGNYRDIAQNRRNDVTFFPRMASFNIQMFLSYIQADAYEPLTVEAVVFRFEDDNDADEVAQKVTADAKSADVLAKVFKGGSFRPGQIFALCEQLNIKLALSNEDVVNTILAKAQDRAMAVYGQGYWGDHWDYYIVSGHVLYNCAVKKPLCL